MKKISIILAIGILMASCSENELYEQTNGLENEPLRISASVSDELTTRADGDFPTDVSFNFLYTPAGESAYEAIEEVKFDSDGNNDKTYLYWEQVKTGNNLYLILDNVTTEDNNKNSTTVTLGDTYYAKPEEGIGEGNDILWKSVKVQDQNLLEPVHFELQHVMSKLTFKINSADTEIRDLLNSGIVTVELWNVVSETSKYKFSRTTGNFTIDDGSTIIDKNDPLDLGTEKITGADYLVKTKSWIFPPQQFLASSTRPTIRITLSSGTEKKVEKTFTGVLPESMTTDEGLKPLEFLSGYHLVINVELGKWTDQSIHFEPVLVKEWDEYGPTDINIKQVGVYDAAGLEELVAAWNVENGPIINELTLMKYGVLNEDTNTWTFDLWADVELESKSTINPDSDGKISLDDNGGFKAEFDYNGGYKVSKGS